MTNDPSIDQKLKDLATQKQRLLEDVAKLTARHIAQVSGFDNESVLISATQEDREGLLADVHALFGFQARLKEINASRRALSS